LEVNVTKVSSRGQVVIPWEIRQSLGIKEGTGLLIFKIGDSIILKSPEVTPASEIASNLQAIRRKIKRLKITRKDVEVEIARARMRGKKAKI
jgi:antitoxin PrlF